MCRVRENVIGSSVPVDHDHMAGRKLLELLLLRSRLRGDHLKAGSHKQALFVLRVLLVVEQPAVNANRAMTPMMVNEVRICFIFVLSLMILICGLRRSLVNAQTNRFALRPARDSAPESKLCGSRTFTCIGLWSYYLWAVRRRPSRRSAIASPMPFEPKQRLRPQSKGARTL